MADSVAVPDPDPLSVAVIWGVCSIETLGGAGSGGVDPPQAVSRIVNRTRLYTSEGQRLYRLASDNRTEFDLVFILANPRVTHRQDGRRGHDVEHALVEKIKLIRVGIVPNQAGVLNRFPVIADDCQGMSVARTRDPD